MYFDIITSGRLSGHLFFGITAVSMLFCNAYHMTEATEGHVCSIDYGFEPNYEDTVECSTYWSCEDHWGTLQYCPGTDQFHFQYGVCMDDNDVSCWIQMEKYYHGVSSHQLQDSEYLTTKTCDMSEGQEPNVYDEGCKSYWHCENHQGSLHVCPEGFQFDWDHLDCAWDEEVMCERQMELHFDSSMYQELHDEEDEGWTYHGNHDGYDAHDWTHYEADDGYDVTEAEHYPSFDSGAHLQRHRCDVESGLEPDDSSDTCQTFWSCQGYMGLLQTCPSGHLFHWAQRECLSDEEVDCDEQRAVSADMEEQEMSRGVAGQRGVSKGVGRQGVSRGVGQKGVSRGVGQKGVSRGVGQQGVSRGVAGQRKMSGAVGEQAMSGELGQQEVSGGVGKQRVSGGARKQGVSSRGGGVGGKHGESGGVRQSGGASGGVKQQGKSAGVSQRGVSGGVSVGGVRRSEGSTGVEQGGAWRALGQEGTSAGGPSGVSSGVDQRAASGGVSGSVGQQGVSGGVSGGVGQRGSSSSGGFGQLWELGGVALRGKSKEP